MQVEVTIKAENGGMSEVADCFEQSITQVILQVALAVKKITESKQHPKKKRFSSAVL